MTFISGSLLISVSACSGPSDFELDIGTVDFSVRAEPPGHMFEERIDVTLLSSLPAKIYYTLDGSDPSTNSPAAKTYAHFISIKDQTLLSFIAVSDDGTWSPSKTELYLKPTNNPPPTPVPRVLDLTADTIFFQAEPGQNEPVHKTVALRSVGSEPVNIKSVSLHSNPKQSIFYDPDAFDIVSDVSLGPLPPGKSIIVEIMYIPSNTLRSDVMQIISNEQRHGGIQQVELWGRVADW